MTGVSDLKEHFDVHVGRILSPGEYAFLRESASGLGYEFGLSDEVVIQLLSDAKTKRAPYEKAAEYFAATEKKEPYVRCFGMQGEELAYVDDLRPFGRIIERALQTAFANMSIEEVQAKRYITDRKGEKVIALITYKTPDFIRKVLDIVLKR